MNILDENIIDNQCQLLRSWRIPFRQIGFGIERQGLQDKEIISLLHRLRRPTFFTRDDDFMIVIYVTRGIVWFTWQSGKTKLLFLCAAFYIIKNLIPEPKRMGSVVRVSHAGISVWRLHTEKQIRFGWTD